MGDQRTTEAEILKSALMVYQDFCLSNDIDFEEEVIDQLDEIAEAEE